MVAQQTPAECTEGTPPPPRPPALLALLRLGSPLPPPQVKTETRVSDAGPPTHEVGCESRFVLPTDPANVPASDALGWPDLGVVPRAGGLAHQPDRAPGRVTCPSESSRGRRRALRSGWGVRGGRSRSSESLPGVGGQVGAESVVGMSSLDVQPLPNRSGYLAPFLRSLIRESPGDETPDPRVRLCPGKPGSLFLSTCLPATKMQV